MTEALLQSLIASNWRAAKDKGQRVDAIGVRSESRWQGPDRIVVDDVPMPVFQCDSVLHAREVLSQQQAAPVVLVTALPLTALGTDVEARLLRHKLLEVEPWDLLRSRFNARSLDASLTGKTALAKAAVEALGATNPDPSPSGVLTAEAAWMVVLDRRLGFREARPDVRALLEWARRPDNVSRWRVLPEDLKTLLSDWLQSYLSDWVPPFWGCLDSGYGGMGLALGFAISVLRHQPKESAERVALAQALGRLERFFGGVPLSPKAQQIWADAAVQWASATAMAGRFDDVSPVLTEAEEILQRIGASDHAHLSEWLGAGFRAHLILLADSIGRDLQVAESELSILENHALPRWSAAERVWLERARMAVRLTRWLQTAEPTESDWAGIVKLYQKNGSWVDVARQALMAGDEPEVVQKAWTALVARATARRERENAAFAKSLADVTRRNATADVAIPIEQVLERIVAPWAKDRVLLILMDGMSFAVWRQLQPEVESRNWVSTSWRDGHPLPPGVTVLPCVTTISRCSLLSGRLCEGGQDAEKRGFAENPSLLDVSKSGVPPVLFHKDEVGAGANNIADTLRKEIRNLNRRVVGVVLNVIDDSLTGPEQRVFRWGLDQIPILRTLLDEANDSGRTVVITADHGHTLDRGAVMRRQSKSDRYRTPDGPLAVDELLVEGVRVVTPTAGFVGLFGEAVRYAASRKLGYHGGLTPQECLVPLIVLSPLVRQSEGWYQSADPQPSWWHPAGMQVAPVVPKKQAKAKAKQLGPLLEGIGLIESDWIQSLTASDVLKSQMQIAGGRLELEKLEAAVRVLASRNGVLLKTAFASQLNMPVFRVDGFLANLQRVLNVDGYQVLSVDASHTVRLDIALLKTQFSITWGN